jgi:hypothetical protein
MDQGGECKPIRIINTYLHWRFVATEFPGFDGETCDGIGAANVKVDVSGPKVDTQTAKCADSQVKLEQLPAGSYTVHMTALDGAGTPLTKGGATTTFTQASENQDVTVDFPYADFVKKYTGGTFFFRTNWGGAERCADAAPPVVKERLRLERAGVAIGGVTVDDHTPLDGSAVGLCRDGRPSDPSQAVTNLDWGPAQMTVTGEDGDGHVMYRKTFDTFVGAGIANPTAVFDVPSILPDAGPADAPAVDAPMVDAPVVDAGGAD